MSWVTCVMTFNDNMKLLSNWINVFVCTVVLVVGCTKQAGEIVQGWSKPIKVTDSKDGLVDGVNLYKWHSTIIALQGLDDRSARCFLMNSDAGSWTEVQITGIPHGYFWAEPEIDQSNDRALFEQGHIETNQLVMKVLTGRMTDQIAFQDVVEMKWVTGKQVLFGKTSQNVSMNGSGRNKWPSLGIGLLNGQEIYVPYCIRGETDHGGTVFGDEGWPFQ